MAIDLGDDPGGTPPSPAEKLQIRTAIGLGQTDAPTFLAQSLTGQSLTGTQATNLLDLATTWDTTGTPTGIKLNATNTNSNPATLLMDLQVSGGTKFKVAKGGSFSFRAGSTFADISSDGVGRILMNPTAPNGVRVSGDLHIGTADVVLIQDAAGILAQRNGSAPQAFRVANQVGALPLTDYDRAVFDFKTTLNTLRIGTENSGTTGYTTARPIDFVTGGVVRMSIGASGTAIFSGAARFDSFFYIGATNSVSLQSGGSATGVLLLQNGVTNNFGRIQLGGTDNTFPAIKRNGTGIDIVLANDSGFAPLSASNVVASGYFSTSGYCIVGSSNGYFWPSKGGMYAPSDGVIRLSNDSVSGFTRLELGTANLGISRGTGSPEGVVTALVGSLYIRTDGGAATTLYVKESSPTPSTGWVAK